MATDLIVVDEEIQAAVRYLMEYNLVLSKMISSFCSVLQSVTFYAIKDEELKKRLMLLANEASKLQRPLSEIAVETGRRCNKYISDLDTADKFLY